MRTEVKAKKLHKFTACFNGETTQTQRLENEVLKFGENSTECGLITKIQRLF